MATTLPDDPEYLKYPIGRFIPLTNYSADSIAQLNQLIESAPAKYEELVTNLTEAELHKTYRAGSWTIRQLVHHVADIHLLNFLRVKKTLTEENYEATLIQMNDWAILPDTILAPVESSLLMFTGINQRFTFLMRHLDQLALNKKFYHPRMQTYLSLVQAWHMAIWHVKHHEAHLQLALGLSPERLVLNQS